MQHILNKSTYSEQLFALVQQRIRNGELRPGDRISEVSLAEECGISRAPVREALYLLETEGLLMSHPKRGRCVTVLTPAQVRHSYELCGVLEGVAASSAALALPEAEWGRLEESLYCMRHTGCGSNDEDKAEQSTAFHAIYLRYAANPLLVSTANKSGRVISKYLMFQHWRTLYTPDEMFERHLPVFNAMQSQVPSRIEVVIREHYADVAERLTAFL